MSLGAAAPLLPDILAEGLSIVFCGINPGIRAASTGHHFDGRGNRFWPVLHRAGFTPLQIDPDKDRSLLQYGYGLTTAVPRATSRADQLSPREVRSASTELERKIEAHAPRYVAFLGKMAFSVLSDDPHLAWGPQAGTFGGARIWILPNPSGLNRGFSLDALVCAYRELLLVVQASS